MTAMETKTEEIVRRDEVAREGVTAVYRLIRDGERFTVSVECGGQTEEVSAFPGGETDADIALAGEADVHDLVVGALAVLRAVDAA